MVEPFGKEVPETNPLLCRVGKDTEQSNSLESGSMTGSISSVQPVAIRRNRITSRPVLYFTFAEELE